LIFHVFGIILIITTSDFIKVDLYCISIKKPMDIEIKMSTGGTLVLEGVDEKMTVSELKEIITTSEKVRRPDQLKLVIDGRVLKN
jgi:hypothetical protein